MTINDEILVLANQIANDGNKPTVALIKAKLTKSVPLPTIISTLRAWQHDPSFIACPQESESNKVKTSIEHCEKDSLSKYLSEELDQMKQEIIELKLLIHELIAQQNNAS